MQKSRMLRKGLWGVGLLLLLGVGMGAYGFTRGGERSDCPGKVICPLTGEEVCRDRCPAIDSSRADCPGQVECPLTGELDCRDRCPLGDSVAATESELPPCCRGRK